MAKFKEPPLQPLRIPTGWEVSFNTFFEVDARFRSWDDTSYNFKEDMLLLKNRHRGVIIDLGWMPSFRSTGRFYLRAVRLLSEAEGGDWEKPMRLLETRSRRKVVTAIEDWLHWYSEHELPQRRKDEGRRRS